MRLAAVMSPRRGVGFVGVVELAFSELVGDGWET